MAPGTPPPPPASQELGSTSLSTPAHLTLSPHASAANSRASSLRGGHSSATSTISDGAASVSSLGGLNHVNDGVGGSTAQRRMSRAYSTDQDLVRRASLAAPLATTIEPIPHHLDVAGEEDDHETTPALTTSASGLSLTSSHSHGHGHGAKRESCWKTWLRKKVPIFGWLISPGYNLQDLPDDIIAGITISTVTIPQAMAYAMLAPLPPVYGLYTSVVPILLYCIFGTSRHMHTGTFAITTLLLGQAVRGLMAKQDELVGTDYSLTNTLLYSPSTINAGDIPIEDPEYEQRFIGMILLLSLVVGCVQIVMSFLRVGGWASKHLLPDALVGGFNTAAVFHIGTSQLKHFLGLEGVPSPQGAFALIKSWIWIGQHFWSGTNWYTVGLGSLAIGFMLLMRRLERSRKAKHELELRKKEMFLVQQRQAVSAAIVRSHEEQRQQQRQWQERQLQKSDSGSVSLHPEPTSPYSDSSPVGALVSNVSLRTMTDDGEHSQQQQGQSQGQNGGPSITFAEGPAIGPHSSNSLASAAARSPSDVERAAAHPIDALAPQPAKRNVYIPIPDILLAVIVLTLLNVAFSLDKPRSEGGFGIDVIGDIPKGLPHFALPLNLVAPGGPKEWMTMAFVERVLLPMLQPALLIAVIIYVMSFSIAKQFAKRYGYKVDADQEMRALGLASIGGSMFSGYACTGSLTRTAILSQSGGKTPLASLVGVVTVTLTLICLTWCFERVPNCVLAAIVLVALQSLVMQITEPLKLWRLGQKKGAIIWTVTFIGVLVISVELGIAIGIVVVLLATTYSWMVNRRGHSRASSHPSLASVANGNGNGQERGPNEEHTDDATTSLLASGSANALGGRRRRQGGSGGVHLSSSEGASPASRGSDWKTRMMRTEWGQRIGSVFGMERPMFASSEEASGRHHAEDDD